MIHVFCNKRGSGKTKALISLANQKVKGMKGNAVYIDDDSRPMHELDREIRFITTDSFNLKDSEAFYGFLCGIISEDYDVETIFIDGLFNIVSGSIKDAAHLFLRIENLAHRHNVEFYINMNHEGIEEIPEFLKKYCA